MNKSNSFIQKNFKTLSGIGIVIFFGAISLLLVSAGPNQGKKSTFEGHLELARSNSGRIPVAHSEEPIRQIINSNYSSNKLRQLVNQGVISLVPSGTRCRGRTYTLDNSFGQVVILEGKFEGDRVWTLMPFIKRIR